MGPSSSTSNRPSDSSCSGRPKLLGGIIRTLCTRGAFQIGILRAKGITFTNRTYAISRSALADSQSRPQLRTSLTGAHSGNELCPYSIRIGTLTRDQIQSRGFCVCVWGVCCLHAASAHASRFSVFPRQGTPPSTLSTLTSSIVSPFGRAGARVSLCGGIN